MNVLGCGIGAAGAAETGACSATPAGEAATQTQSVQAVVRVQARGVA